MSRFAPKVLPDGRALLNLGCGWKMHWGWNNLDFSPYAKLVRRPLLRKILRAAGLLSPLREERLARVDPQILCWDLRRGIPFADGTFDVVYHSHFLEHLPRDAAPVVLQECRRVLKPGGVLRVVVPDWELLTHWYRAALKAWDEGAPDGPKRHEQAMYDLIDQMVRDAAFGPAKQSLFGRLENRFRGGAAGTGELHKWMYDRRSLAALLEAAGLREPRQETSRTSRVAGWVEFGLDLDDAGQDYKPESLYVEAVK